MRIDTEEKGVKRLNINAMRLAERNNVLDIRAGLKPYAIKREVDKIYTKMAITRRRIHKNNPDKRKSIKQRVINQLVNAEIEKTARQSMKMVQSQLVCGKGGFCHSFNKTGSEDLKRIFNGYVDFSLVTEHGELNKGANGKVERIVYEKGGLSSVAILKTSLSKYADNLFYEYIVGKCFINRIKNCFPCFCETYALFSHFNWKSNKKHIINIEDIEKDIKEDKEGLIRRTCLHPENFSVLSEYVESEKSLYKLFKTKTDKDERILYCLFQVYFALAVLRKNFTHYDLHANNVIVYVPKPGHYIQYNYVFHDETISFKSQYCVKIIDYGRCFFDNRDLFGHKTNASITDKRTTDEQSVASNAFVSPEEPLFESSRVLHEKLKTFTGGIDDYGEEKIKYKGCLREKGKEGPSGENINGYNYFFKENRSEEDKIDTFRVDFAEKNESHDVKLIKNIYNSDIIKYYEEYGTPEDLRVGVKESFQDSEIYNVYDACQFLAKRIKQPMETYINNAMYPSDFNKIGDLTVYSDGREMEFSLNTPVVSHSVKRAGKTRKSKK